MRQLFSKVCAVALVSLLAQGCTEDDLAPVSSTSTAVMESEQASAEARVNVNNAFSARVRPYSLDYSIAEITLEGAELGKTITINWGDGNSETRTFTDVFDGKPRLYLTHSYTTLEEVTIAITGDIDNIISVIDPFNSVETFAMNFDKLTNLEVIDMPYNSMVTVDVSKNHKLKTFYGPSSTATMNIVLPQTHELSYVLSGCPNLPTEVVSKMIATVHRNAVNKKIYNGYFRLWNNISEEDYFFPGPPTEKDFAKLRELRDVYGWTIIPELDSVQVN